MVVVLDSDGARVQEYQHDHKPEPGRGLRKYYLKYLKMLLENIILRVVEEDEYNQNQAGVWKNIILRASGFSHDGTWFAFMETLNRTIVSNLDFTVLVQNPA